MTTTNDMSAPANDKTAPTNDKTAPTNDKTAPTNEMSTLANDISAPTTDCTKKTYEIIQYIALNHAIISAGALAKWIASLDTAYTAGVAITPAGPTFECRLLIHALKMVGSIADPIAAVFRATCAAIVSAELQARTVRLTRTELRDLMAHAATFHLTAAHSPQVCDGFVELVQSAPHATRADENMYVVVALKSRDGDPYLIALGRSPPNFTHWKHPGLRQMLHALHQSAHTSTYGKEWIVWLLAMSTDIPCPVYRPFDTPPDAAPHLGKRPAPEIAAVPRRRTEPTAPPYTPAPEIPTTQAAVAPIATTATPTAVAATPVTTTAAVTPVTAAVAPVTAAVTPVTAVAPVATTQTGALAPDIDPEIIAALTPCTTYPPYTPVQSLRPTADWWDTANTTLL